MLNTRHSLFITVTLACCLAGIVLSGYHQPFLADDWQWLSLALTTPQFKWTDHVSFSRMPASVWVWTTFAKTSLWEHYPRFPLLVFFSLHALAFALFLKTLIERSRTTLSLQI